MNCRLRQRGRGHRRATREGGGLVGDWDGGDKVGARDGVCVGRWKRGVLGHALIHCRLPNPLVYGFGPLEIVLLDLKCRAWQIE